MTDKIRMKDLRKAMGDVDMNGMFEEMTGVKDADSSIIIPKFVFVRNTLRHIYRVFVQFHDMLIKDFASFGSSLAEVKKFAEDLKESAYLKHEHEEKETAYQNVSKEAINSLYRKLKENQFVKALVVLCSKLNRYQNSFTDSKTLKLNFVNQEPGLTFKIFDFSSLDLKALWANPSMKDSVKRYILMVFASIHKHTHALYRCITSPDVDVDKFTAALMSAIGELKKTPKLHRCQGAFRRIEQSVELLKDKFDDYYRESVASENADMLVMNFIVDVSNQGGANASLTREFRTIIQYMHEVGQKSGKNKDPNVKKIFTMLNNNFAMMEKKTGVKPMKLDETTPEVAETDPMNSQQIAEEKQSKRIEKQKAKKLAKKKKKKDSKVGEVVDDDVVDDVVVDDVVDDDAVGEEEVDDAVGDDAVGEEVDDVVVNSEVADETYNFNQNDKNIVSGTPIDDYEDDQTYEDDVDNCEVANDEETN